MKKKALGVFLLATLFLSFSKDYSFAATCNAAYSPSPPTISSTITVTITNLDTDVYYVHLRKVDPSRFNPDLLFIDRQESPRVQRGTANVQFSINLAQKNLDPGGTYQLLIGNKDQQRECLGQGNTTFTVTVPQGEICDLTPAEISRSTPKATFTYKNSALSGRTVCLSSSWFGPKPITLNAEGADSYEMTPHTDQFDQLRPQQSIQYTQPSQGLNPCPLNRTPQILCRKEFTIQEDVIQPPPDNCTYVGSYGQCWDTLPCNNNDGKGWPSGHTIEVNKYVCLDGSEDFKCRSIGNIGQCPDTDSPLPLGSCRVCPADSPAFDGINNRCCKAFIHGQCKLSGFKNSTIETCGPNVACTPGLGCGDVSSGSDTPPPPCKEGERTDKGSCKVIITQLGDIAVNPSEFVASIMGIILGFSGGIAILLITIAGYQLLTSQGNPEKIQAARERLTGAIVGLLFIIFSFVILEVIGVNILQLPVFIK